MGLIIHFHIFMYLGVLNNLANGPFGPCFIFVVWSLRFRFGWDLGQITLIRVEFGSIIGLLNNKLVMQLSIFFFHNNKRVSTHQASTGKGDEKGRQHCLLNWTWTLHTSKLNDSHRPPWWNVYLVPLSYHTIMQLRMKFWFVLYLGWVNLSFG